MTNNLSHIIVLTCLALLIASLIIETILSIFWNKTYFTLGFPVFVLRVPIGPDHTTIPNQSQLEAKFHSLWAKSLVFKQLDSNLYGFRGDFFSFRFMRSSVIMHGLLWFDHENNQVVAKGFVNWFMWCFALIWLGAPLFSAKPLMAIVSAFMFVFFMGMLCLVQYYRFSQVATFAAQECTRKYS